VIVAATGAALLAVAAYLLVGRRPPAKGSISSEGSVAPPARPSAASPSPTPRAPSPSTPAAGTPATPRAAGDLARLRIDADVPRASVFFDHNFLGRTPVEVRDVVPGSHRLNVSAEGHEMYAETLEITPGPHDVMVRFKQVRLDEALDVVHRHGIGSCQGRLIATPAGLRYETDHQEDAFNRSFDDLEPLEVDSQKKNLRVRMRGGKTYNFTTKAPTAADLLRFQQKVELARKTP
jgi:hypothetical protein